MADYRVTVRFEIEIEAESQEKAIKIAEDSVPIESIEQDVISITEI